MSENEFNKKFLIHRKHAIGYFKKKYKFSNDEAEDFVQTAYLMLYKKFYNTNIDCEYPRQYLFNSVKNSIYVHLYRKNYVKNEKNFTQLNISTPIVFLDSLNKLNQDSFTDNIVEKKTIFKEINYLIEKLSETHPDYSNVIKMYYFDNLTGPEIAEKLNVPVNTIKTRLFRAKNKIKELTRDKMLVSAL
jgi:RNA polymerase sigma-70 factor (ECF subfamily)